MFDKHSGKTHQFRYPARHALVCEDDGTNEIDISVSASNASVAGPRAEGLARAEKWDGD
jgi:hypothetical protein